MIRFQWDGEAMVPANGFFAERCNKQFVVGEIYVLEESQDRSIASHRHYFACIGEAWKNLSDEQLEQYPTPEHLRKKALIKSGYADERTIVCASKAEAQRFAAFIRPIDEYAIVNFREATVTVWTAQSQSTRAMGKQEFGESKNKVLDVVSNLIGIDVTTLQQNAGAAA